MFTLTHVHPPHSVTGCLVNGRKVLHLSYLCSWWYYFSMGCRPQIIISSLVISVSYENFVTVLTSVYHSIALARGTVPIEACYSASWRSNDFLSERQTRWGYRGGNDAPCMTFSFSHIYLWYSCRNSLCVSSWLNTLNGPLRSMWKNYFELGDYTVWFMAIYVVSKHIWPCYNKMKHTAVFLNNFVVMESIWKHLDFWSIWK